MHLVAEMSAFGHLENSAFNEQSAVEGFLLRSARFIVRRFMRVKYGSSGLAVENMRSLAPF